MLKSTPKLHISHYHQVVFVVCSRLLSHKPTVLNCRTSHTLSVVTTKECIPSIGGSCGSLREKFFVVVVNTVSCRLSCGVVVFTLSFVDTVGTYLDGWVCLVGSDLQSCVLLTITWEVKGVIIEVKFHSDLLFIVRSCSEGTLSESRIGRVTTTQSSVHIQEENQSIFSHNWSVVWDLSCYGCAFGAYLGPEVGRRVLSRVYHWIFLNRNHLGVAKVLKVPRSSVCTKVRGNLLKTSCGKVYSGGLNKESWVGSDGLVTVYCICYYVNWAEVGVVCSGESACCRVPNLRRYCKNLACRKVAYIITRNLKNATTRVTSISTNHLPVCSTW